MCSDTSTWFNAVEALDGTGPGPSPLDMVLADVYSLLTPEFFPEDPSISTKQVSVAAAALVPHVMLVWGLHFEEGDDNQLETTRFKLVVLLCPSSSDLSRLRCGPS